MNPMENVDDDFTRFFAGLGCAVTWDYHGGARWYEILDEDRLVMQIDMGVPLAHFLEDLPLLAQDKPGTSSSKYEVRIERESDLKEICVRVAKATKIRQASDETLDRLKFVSGEPK